MKKWIFSLSLLLCAYFINSPKINHNEHEHASALTVAPKMLKASDARFIQPYSVNAGYLAVKGMEVKGFDAQSLEKVEQAFSVLEKVVNSEEFKSRVLNFVNTQGKTEFASNKGLTNINWKFFKSFKPSDVAGNFAHEWTHKIGFDHKSAAEHDSAPYAIGYIVREMAERAAKGEELH